MDKSLYLIILASLFFVGCSVQNGTQGTVPSDQPAVTACTLHYECDGNNLMNVNTDCTKTLFSKCFGGCSNGICNVCDTKPKCQVTNTGASVLITNSSDCNPAKVSKTSCEYGCKNNVCKVGLPSCSATVYESDTYTQGVITGQLSIISKALPEDDGTTINPGQVGTFTDYCIDTYKLNKYFCLIEKEDSVSRVYLKSVNCQNGCENGACKRPTLR